MKSSAKPWTSVLRPFEELLKKLLQAVFLLFVGAYRTLGTTHLGGACRFSPSCSEYAVTALHTHSIFYALFLVTKRVFKCRPGGSCGYDPVPLGGGECHARPK